MTGLNQALLFDNSLVDVSDVAKGIGQQLGGWHENVLEVVVSKGKWKALPWGNIGQLEVYRTDWFKEAGVNKFPRPGRTCSPPAACSRRMAIRSAVELGHGFGDNHGWLYPLFWSYGAREVDRGRQDGRHRLVGDGQGRRLLPQVLPGDDVEDVLGWTDVNNNKAFFGEQISCTQQRPRPSWSSARRTSGDRQGHRPRAEPGRAQGPLHVVNAVSHALLTHAPDPAAGKAFLKCSTTTSSSRAGSSRLTRTTRPTCTATTNHPMWNSEPRYLPYKECLKTTRPAHVAGPAGPRGPESVAKYVLVDMFAKACRGDANEGRHRHRRRPAQARSTKRSKRMAVAPRPSPGRPRRGPAGHAARPARARGRLQLADAGARRPLPARLRRLPVLLWHLPEPEERRVASQGVFVGLGNFQTAVARRRVLAGHAQHLHLRDGDHGLQAWPAGSAWRW